MLAQPTAAVAAAAATVSTAAHSIFSGLMTTLPTSLSSQRRTCAVNVEQGLSFTCGFLSNHTEAESVGVLCANRHEVVEGSNDETAQTKTSAYPTNGREMFPGANDHLVVVTSMGIVSLHRFNLMEGTSQLENQQFLLEQASSVHQSRNRFNFLFQTYDFCCCCCRCRCFCCCRHRSLLGFLTQSSLSPKSLYFHPNRKTQHSSDAEGAISNQCKAHLHVPAVSLIYGSEPNPKTITVHPHHRTPKSSVW